MVFVVLSDKYLKSRYCMYELYEVWRNRKQDKKEFLNHVRVYTVPGTKIGDLSEWTIYADYWAEKCDTIDAIVKKRGAEILGKMGGEDHYRMKQFSLHIVDMLKTLTEIRQPRDFEELKTYGFSDSPG